MAVTAISDVAAFRAWYSPLLELTAPSADRRNDRWGTLLWFLIKPFFAQEHFARCCGSVVTIIYLVGFASASIARESASFSRRTVKATGQRGNIKRSFLISFRAGERNGVFSALPSRGSFRRVRTRCSQRSKPETVAVIHGAGAVDLTKALKHVFAFLRREWLAGRYRSKRICRARSFSALRRRRTGSGMPGIIQQDLRALPEMLRAATP